jgi:hypothetical protein
LQGFIVDDEDSSLTRSNQYMLELFEKAGMQVRSGRFVIGVPVCWCQGWSRACGGWQGSPALRL